MLLLIIRRTLLTMVSAFFAMLPATLMGIEPSGEVLRIHPQDAHYAQQQEELEDWHRALARQQPLQELRELRVYRYMLKEPTTLITLAARFTLPYSALSTINRISRNADLTENSELLIPAAPGLFIPLEPSSDLERLMYERRINSEDLPPYQQLTIDNGVERRQFLFLPGEDFSALERIAFFGRLFRNPIRTGKISSLFGTRPDPFTGDPSFHYGVDFATAEHQQVYAAREGKVQQVILNDPIYGNYVVVEHDGGFETLYAHMNSIVVLEGQRVTNSSQLGTVGNTGHSTGPHVHFEVHHYGNILDPTIYLQKLDIIQYAGDQK